MSKEASMNDADKDRLTRRRFLLGTGAIAVFAQAATDLMAQARGRGGEGRGRGNPGRRKGQ
jgi:hypothetical protein